MNYVNMLGGPQCETLSSGHPTKFKDRSLTLCILGSHTSGTHGPHLDSINKLHFLSQKFFAWHSSLLKCLTPQVLKCSSVQVLTHSKGQYKV